jgi:hypothetical protein
MFEVDCEACGGPVLLTTRRVVAMHNTAGGIRVAWRCWRGHDGVLWTGTVRLDGAPEPAARSLTTAS